jgi:glycosyltransferase involved in cell wall biosynthesis
MQKTKVLRIITRLNIGGPTIHTVLLNSKLDPNKYESYLLCGRIEAHESDMSYYAEKYNVLPIYINDLCRELRPFQDLKALVQMIRIIRKIKPDIVHTHTAKAGTLGRLAAIILRVQIIIHTFHGNIFKGYFGKLKTKFFVYIEKFLSLFSTKIITISKQQKKEIIDLGISKKEKIEVINLGFDFKNILPSGMEKDVFRKDFNIPKDKKLIGIIGRLTPIKNHHLFLDIAQIVSKKKTDIQFVIIGDGESRKEIQNEITKRQLDGNVFITGFIQNLKPVYADLDLVLLTSKNEGTPVALIEAMAAKKVVMSTQVGGVEDFVDNGVNGFYFPQEPQSFADEICKYFDHQKEYFYMKEKATITSLKKFSSERLIKDIDELYSKLIESKK